MADERAHLTHAGRHIAECKERIALQEMLIRQMKQRGECTDWAFAKS